MGRGPEVKPGSLAAVLALGLFAGGCRFGRKPKAAPPPAPPPVVAPKAEPSVVEPPPVETARPVPPQAVPAPVPPVIAPVPQPPAEPKPVRRRPRATPARKPAPAPAVAPESPAAPEPQAPPGLGEVLSPEQRRQFDAALDADAAAIRRVLASIQRRTLTRDQTETAARIRSFLAQSEDLRRADLPAAAALARRGTLLARDLEAGLR
jgi:outer membrane biosynthesis protein TonB